MSIVSSRAALLVGALFVAFPAQAQLEWGQEYANRVRARETLTTLGPDLFGDQTNLFDGTTSFSTTDLAIPGNGALPLTVGRRLQIGSTNNTAQEGLFGDWELSLPYLSNVSVTSSGWQAPPDPSAYWIVAGPNPAARCSAPQAPGDVNAVEIPNTLVNAGAAGGEMFLLTSTTSTKLTRPSIPGVRWLTKGFWYLGCTPTLASGQAGEGFWAVDTNGTRYTFDWMVRYAYPGFSTPAIASGSQIIMNRSELRLYPTRVEDRFGNWVRYDWQGRRLLRIVASDGRRVDFTYGVDDQIVSATAHGRTWTYLYRDHQTPGVGGQLLTVTNPDGAKWEYGNNPGPWVQYEPRYEYRSSYTPGGSLVFREHEVLEKVTFCSYDHYLSPVVVPFTIRHPSGARGEFRFKTTRHGRTNVPGACQFSWDGSDGAPREAQNSHNLYPAFKDVWSLVGKSVEGAGVAPLTWGFSYADLQACIVTTCAQNGAPPRKTVTVTQPNGDALVHTFGKRHGLDEGQLLSVETTRGGVQAAREEYTYVSDAEAGGAPFPALVGESSTEFADPFSASLRPLRQTTRRQDGTTFGTTVNAFDAFARPVQVSRWNDVGFGKTDVTEYRVDLARWVIDSVQRRTNAETGVVVEETEFDERLLPLRQFEYGSLKRTFSHWPDGTVRALTDARGFVTTLSDYHRGIPRLLTHPPTAEAPSGAQEQVAVSDLGWVTAITDETGARTCYDYDAMGRLSGVTQPSGTQLGLCDTSRWEASVTVFEFVTVAERGFESGHWRRTRSEGPRRKSVTYYDALWRPVLEESWDSNNPVDTQTQVVRRYDFAGRLTFESFPTRGVENLAQAQTGTRTTVDALGRPVRVEQDSELGVIAQSTDYLSGLRARLTNPRGFQTTVSYQAWDTFSAEAPIKLEQPEGKVVELVRHPRFGWPLSLTQRDTAGTLTQTRAWVYSGSKVCKSLDPESGATVTGYDASDNPVWSASGLTGLDSLTDCSVDQALASGSVVRREFDGRNRLTRVLYPDGRGDELRTYERDGLLSSVTAFNDPGNATPVITSYTYDPRRFVVSETSRQAGWYSWTIASDTDRLGSLRVQQYPTGLTLDFAPNALGQPTQLRDQTNRVYVSNASYHPNGALRSFLYGNGLPYSMTQNARQLPREVRSGEASALRYDYDPARNVVQLTDLAEATSPRTRAMTFDGLDRLTSVSASMFGGADGRHVFSFDALDNLRSWRLAGQKDLTYVYDSRNRLAELRNSSGGLLMTLRHDAQGNVVGRGNDVFEYDVGNRLRSVVGREGYRYDGLGRRVLSWQPASGTTVLFQYDRGGQLLYETNGAVQTEHLSFMNSLVAERSTNLSTGTVAVSYLHTDALGSVVARTNEAGVVTDRNDYEPYGVVIGEPTFSGRGFTGHVTDQSSGLVYMQQRYFDPTLGRFLSIDPLGSLAPAEPESVFQAKTLNFNRYWYANGNPYRFVDPDGRQVRENAEQLLKTADPSVSPQERKQLLDVMEDHVRGELDRTAVLGVYRPSVIKEYTITLNTQVDSKGRSLGTIRISKGDYAKLQRLATKLERTKPAEVKRLREILATGIRSGRIFIRDVKKK
jgi:RHS repeat-associated protein